MPAANLSLARQRFDNVLRFSTALNETLSAFSIPAQLAPEAEARVMSQTRTFMLLVTVGGFDVFLTERCQELSVRPMRNRRAVSPKSASFKQKLCALRASSVPADVWAARVEDAHERYYKARTLWMHGAGIPAAVGGRPRDLSVFDPDSDGRCWVSERLWSGCVRALEGLADDCR
jgi:hypothetical protein